MTRRRTRLLRFDAPAAALAGKGLRWQTVCQANPATFPRLRDGENRVTYHASGVGIASAGPPKAQAQARVIDCMVGSKNGWCRNGNPRAASGRCESTRPAG